MKQFEYKVIVAGNGLELEQELNRRGKKGWEAFGVKVKDWANGTQSVIAYLKREKPQQPK